MAPRSARSWRRARPLVALLGSLAVSLVVFTVLDDPGDEPTVQQGASRTAPTVLGTTVTSLPLAGPASPVVFTIPDATTSTDSGPGTSPGTTSTSSSTSPTIAPPVTIISPTTSRPLPTTTSTTTPTTAPTTTTTEGSTTTTTGGG